MTEPDFSELVGRMKQTGNFDHPDMDEIDSIGKKHGAGQKTSREAFFVARDIKSLEESEKLDGGTGKESRKVDPRAILEATFAKGK